ncbi:hypothetical protein H5410_047164 [Solanum commersonii]|uniref:Uncharacterized protein n=1 Tax=Solanum commersonii TaxID=4109 RepID=A0A9J5XGD9_SOLCO|nr:hypothetical protein H5410_047164 [Solanum commersonii]
MGGVSKGRELSHVMHENLIDPKTDPRAPTTSKNFPSRPKIILVNCDSNTIEDNNDDYRVVNYKEEYDPDHLEEHEDDDENSAHLLKAFGSTMNSDCQDEIQQVTQKAGLSPRGQKEKKEKNIQNIISNSANTITAKSNINTRSKSQKH